MRFTQTYSKKKFANKLLEKDNVGELIENFMETENYDLETYEILKKRSQEMEEEDLQKQLELCCDTRGQGN